MSHEAAAKVCSNFEIRNFLQILKIFTKLITGNKNKTNGIAYATKSKINPMGIIKQHISHKNIEIFFDILYSKNLIITIYKYY